MVAAGDDGVGPPDGQALVADAFEGFVLRDTSAVLHLGKRVEHCGMGDAQTAGDDRRGPGALPVMRMDEVVAAPLASREVEDARREGADVGHLVFLIERLSGSSRDPDEPKTRRYRLDVGPVAVATGEHVDFVAQRG